MAPDRRRWCDNRITRFCHCHEHTEICHAPGRQTQLNKARTESGGGQRRGDHFDLLDRLQAGFLFQSRIAERGSRAHAAAEECLGARVHHIAGGIQIDAVLPVDLIVGVDEPLDVLGNVFQGVACVEDYRRSDCVAYVTDPRTGLQHERQVCCMRDARGPAVLSTGTDRMRLRV